MTTLERAVLLSLVAGFSLGISMGVGIGSVMARQSVCKVIAVAWHSNCLRDGGSAEYCQFIYEHKKLKE